jgi:N-acetylglutamate synthase
MYGWTLQATDGRSGRVNAAWPLAWTGEVDLATAIEAVEAWYAERDRPAWFRLAEAGVAPPELAAALAQRGYLPDTETLVMSAALGARPNDDGVVIAPDPGEDFFALMREATPDAGEYAERRDVTLRTPAPRAFAMLKLDDRPAAVGASVITGELALVFIMRTAPWARRRGLARRVLRALMAWAPGNGATTAYLQVEAENTGAVALYRTEGFATTHAYAYWRPGQANGGEHAV